MPDYRRHLRHGGTYFFTLVTESRRRFLCDDRPRALLREAIETCRTAKPFELVAIVLLPDHLHLMMSLPPGDAGFSVRIAHLKAAFTRAFLAGGGVEAGRADSRVRHRNRGVWQRRFWEHCVRDDQDFERHLHYIHYNPVKHGLAACPHEWPYSSFHRWVQLNAYAPDWLCACDRPSPAPPPMIDALAEVGE